ncbi:MULTISPECIES: UBP-type zinc finger domain-containing protein [Cupriavidus]
MPTVCQHLALSHAVTPGSSGCEECLRSGDEWVHLRICLCCGHVGCCDSSPNQHASRHFLATQHPVVRSFEPGESWRWCYIDKLFIP